MNLNLQSTTVVEFYCFIISKWFKMFEIIIAITNLILIGQLVFKIIFYF